MWHPDSLMPEELLIFCPACKALEVVQFSGHALIPTRKFAQKEDKVYHTCGSHVACRLHSSAGGGTLHKAGHETVLSLPSRRSVHARVIAN